MKDKLEVVRTLLLVSAVAALARGVIVLFTLGLFFAPAMALMDGFGGALAALPIIIGALYMALGFWLLNIKKLTDNEILQRKERFLILGLVLLSGGVSILNLVSVGSILSIFALIYEFDASTDEDKVDIQVNDKVNNSFQENVKIKPETVDDKAAEDFIADYTTKGTSEVNHEPTLDEFVSTFSKEKELPELPANTEGNNILDDLVVKETPEELITVTEAFSLMNEGLLTKDEFIEIKKANLRKIK